ncbi:hypothetical protein V1J52_16670 [Streptomyces sp. TRM 70351]|uniref:hypothetical protein n=1 Tax=Streptomyces sp. TRM 70351 TaxID=3116552 RepID=UPI002E7C2B63|nr:hypothetical protein [Streptomyces sp. TRM 70351]MEE1929800.1 hypothetical protein [Streptomyces sp. TRM 70351]
MRQTMRRARARARTRTSAVRIAAATVAATTAAGVAAALAGAGPAQATATAVPSTSGSASGSASTSAAPSAHELLEAGDLPRARTPWVAGPVTEGAGGQRFCVDGLVPDTGAVHRDFHTDLETSAFQVVYRAANEREARQLTARLRAAVENCADELAEQYPEASVSERDYGRVHGIETAFPESSLNVNLLGVAREGAFVTVVQWGQMGTLETAPVRGFKKTLRTAETRLR